MKVDKTIEWQRMGVDALNLQGLEVAVVGGTGGLGRALARQMASRGAKVLVVGQTFRDAGQPGIRFLKADLSLMGEAERVTAEISAETLDLLVLTTGIFAAPKRQETAEGIERDMAVSYLSRLVIVRSVASRLGSKRKAPSGKPRIFVMGFPGTGQVGKSDDLNAEKSYQGMAVHMNTVAGNEMLVLDAAKRYSRINTYGLNPGFIKTNIRSNLFRPQGLAFRLVEGLIGLLTPAPEAYAKEIVPLLVSPDLEDLGGTLFDSKGRAIFPSPGLSSDHIESYLQASEILSKKRK